MLRLFYLPIFAAVILAQIGCAGSAWWLADDGESTAKESRKAKPRAGALANSEEKSESQEQKSETKKNGTDGLTSHSAGDTRSTGSRHSEQSDAVTQRTAPTREAQNGSGESSGDPLAEQVRALGFDDPADSASALAALRAAPPQHRQFLLRTMQASAAVRKQHESRESPSTRNSTTHSPSAEGMSATSTSVNATKANPNRFAQMLANSSSATLAYDQQDHRESTARRHDRTADVDPNVVAVIEAEPVEEPRSLVKPASYSESVPSSTEDRSRNVQHAQPAVTVAPLATERWQTYVQSAISTLETELSGGKVGPERSALESKLRLLYLAVDRRDEALRSRAGSSVEEQEFWSEELFGLSTLFDPQKPADAGQRAAVATPHLRQAAERLGNMAGLVVKNLHFCTEVKGYGTFLPFAHDEFNAGQEVLLYCEVENFQSKLVAEKGYHTALKAKYEVFSEGGNRVADKDLGLKEEHCLNRRRDFFVPYFLWLPKQVPSGKYQLKLTLEDVHGGKSAESTIDFVIKEK